MRTRQASDHYGNIRSWNNPFGFLKKMMEYAYGVTKDKKSKSVFVNFITQVSPACDCYGHNDLPIVGDLGILASRDPVAIDQACADLVNKSRGLPGSALKNKSAGTDKFKDIYPQVDWPQLEYPPRPGAGIQLVKVRLGFERPGRPLPSSPTPRGSEPGP
jgi:uncharacterized Fe-S center protein